MRLTVHETRERAAIEAFLRRDPALHLYELGDLDPFFWPRTRWLLGVDAAGDVQAAALLYDGGDHRTLIALGREGDPAPGALLAAAGGRLPERCYAHLQPGLRAALAAEWRVEPRGLFLRMSLTEREAVAREDGQGVTALGPSDLAELRAFYARAYPDNWFDPTMLETGAYAGVRLDGALVAVAGVHVVAPEVGVAALGNITTDPAHRGRGLARRATAAVCRALLERGVETIGLNVAADNAAAIACYARLGFRREAAFDEAQLDRRAR